RLAIGDQRRPIGRRVEYRDRQCCGISPGSNSCLAQPSRCTLGLPARARPWEPAVAELNHPAHRVVTLAAEEDGRMWPLLWVGTEPDRIEIDELAMKLSLLLGPKRLHCQHALAQQLETGLIAGAMVFHLIDIPTTTDRKNEPAARELIEACHRFCGDDRVSL